MSHLAAHRIILSTPEKWEYFGRSCEFRAKVQISLLLIDEVHMLGDERGHALESLVTRLKIQNKALRIIAVSATVSNIGEICQWIAFGSPKGCKQLQFSDSSRGVPLERKVVGYPVEKNYKFTQDNLNSVLLGVLRANEFQRMCSLIFCPTKKATVETAKLIQSSLCANGGKRWRCEGEFADRELGFLVQFGIAFHHSKLLPKDKALVIEMALQKRISVICSTSTLSTGVNLPITMVIIKGTQIYSNNQNIEYKAADIIQMMGRAGRPQFDQRGLAFILTEESKVAFYETLSNADALVESHLGDWICEAVLHEISAGIIQTGEDAMKWMKYSFWFHSRNSDCTFTDRAIEKLQSLGLIDSSLKITESGIIFSRFCLNCFQFELIQNLLQQNQLPNILQICCKCCEGAENKVTRSLSSLLSKISCKFPLCKSVEKGWEKYFVLFQRHLSGEEQGTGSCNNIPSYLRIEINEILENLKKILRASLELAALLKFQPSTIATIKLLSSANAGMWYDRVNGTTLQIPGIGPKNMRFLQSKGICRIRDFMGEYKEFCAKIGKKAFKKSFDYANSVPSFVTKIIDEKGKRRARIKVLNHGKYPMVIPVHFFIVIGIDTEIVYQKRLLISQFEREFEIDLSSFIDGSFYEVHLLCEEFISLDHSYSCNLGQKSVCIARGKTSSSPSSIIKPSCRHSCTDKKDCVHMCCKVNLESASVHETLPIAQVTQMSFKHSLKVFKQLIPQKKMETDPIQVEPIKIWLDRFRRKPEKNGLSDFYLKFY